MPSKRGQKWMARPKVNGKHIYLGTYDTKREAKQVEEEYRTKRSRLASDITVKELRDRWLKEWGQGRWQKSTLSMHTRRTQKFVDLVGSRRVSDVTIPEARVFAADNPSTAASLSAMFGYALGLGASEMNPFLRSRPPVKQRWVRPGRGALRPGEVYDLAGCADEWMGSLIVFAAFTGLRVGEVLAVRWGDISGDSLLVARAVSPETGEVDTPKNHRSRDVILPPQARDALKVVPRHTGTDVVFCRPYGGYWLERKLYDRWDPVRRAFHEQLPADHWLSERVRFCEARRAEEPDANRRKRMDRGWLKFHELRHTCATMLVEAGVDDRDVAVQLGHTDGGALVRSTYGHPSRERSLDRVRAAFGRVEGEAPVLRSVEGGRAS